MFTRTFTLLSVLLAVLLLAACTRTTRQTQDTIMTLTEQNITAAIDSLLALHGDMHAARIEQGVRQAARMWRSEDGSADDFLALCNAQFITDPDLLDATFERFEHNLMLINGYMTELRRDLMVPLHLDTGPIHPVDHLFGAFAPHAHLSEDMFRTKLAFVVLLNFPLTTLQERLEEGGDWQRRQWAEVRLAQRFNTRIPSEANQQVAAAYTTADTYISSYNICMHNVVDAQGERLFPEGLKLISHWGLRDELKAQYAKQDGLPRQRLIHSIMERIITQEIPGEVIDNPAVDWHIAENIVVPYGSSPAGVQSAEREPDTRYEMWLKVFNAERAVDPYHPDNPTHIDRRFNEDREIPETEVEQLFINILSSPLIQETAALIRERLGRKLEPFDIWYPGLKTRPPLTEDELDRIVMKKYPSVKAFEQDIPNILVRLGFAFDKAQFLAGRITVDAARGAGHAMGAGRLSDNAHLRTRVPQEGMNYKGYNIAIHELGHNVEQVMSFQMMDHTLLRGVPNTAFTEGFAFVFQSRDLALLGLDVSDPNAEALNTLDVLWSTYEIAGVALTDMRVWRWLYENPDATPEQLREAVLRIAKEVWNSYFAPVFGVKDEPLLAIYSHTIDGGMYTPDYPLGHIIAFQIEQYLKDRELAVEMERMCTIGSLSPDLWMRTAVGSPISTQPLLDAAREALVILKQ
ncbi:MAG: hypothetical protein JXA28_06445 [Bacteroidetes bacterium]|nr:hypothetical protein [Bacteroidota bacterium]